MTDAQFNNLMSVHFKGDPANTDILKRAGLIKVAESLNMQPELVKFFKIKEYDTFPRDLTLTNGVVIPHGTQIQANQIPLVSFENFLAAANQTGIVSYRAHDRRNNLHEQNYAAMMKDSEKAPENLMGRMNEAMVRICKSLGIDINHPDFAGLLARCNGVPKTSAYDKLNESFKINKPGSYKTLIKDVPVHDKVALDNPEFVEKVVNHVINNAETLLTTDNNAKLQAYRDGIGKDIEKFWKSIGEGRAGMVVPAKAKKEITAAIKKLAYTQSADSIFKALKTNLEDKKGDEELEYMLPKNLLLTAVNRTRTHAERQLADKFAQYGLKLHDVLGQVNGRDVHLGDIVSDTVAGARTQAASAILHESLDKKRGAGAVFDESLLKKNDCKIPEEHKDWGKISKEDKKKAGPSKYAKVSKPPYRGLINILKMMEQLTQAATVGFQKTTLAAAWYKSEKTPDYLSKKGIMESPYKWGLEQQQKTEDFLNNKTEFDEAVKNNKDLEWMREEYDDLLLTDPDEADMVLRKIALAVGIVKKENADDKTASTNAAPASAGSSVTRSTGGTTSGGFSGGFGNSDARIERWGAAASAENKELVGLAMVMERYGDLKIDEFRVEAKQRKAAGEDEATVNADILARTQGVINAQTGFQEYQTAIKTIPSNVFMSIPLSNKQDEYDRVYARASGLPSASTFDAVTGENREGKLVMQTLANELCACVSGVAGVADPSSRVKSILGIEDSMISLSGVGINRNTFNNARALAASGDYFAFMMELNKQKANILQRVSAKEVSNGGTTRP